MRFAIAFALATLLVFGQARIARRQSGGCGCASKWHETVGVTGVTDYYLLARSYSNSDIADAINAAEDGGVG